MYYSTWSSHFVKNLRSDTIIYPSQSCGLEIGPKHQIGRMPSPLFHFLSLSFVSFCLQTNCWPSIGSQIFPRRWTRGMRGMWKTKGEFGNKANRREETTILAVPYPAPVLNKEGHLQWVKRCIGFSLGFSTSITSLIPKEPKHKSWKMPWFLTVSDKSIYFNIAIASFLPYL